METAGVQKTLDLDKFESSFPIHPHPTPMTLRLLIHINKPLLNKV